MTRSLGHDLGFGVALLRRATSPHKQSSMAYGSGLSGSRCRLDHLQKSCCDQSMNCGFRCCWRCRSYERRTKPSAHKPTGYWFSQRPSDGVSVHKEVFHGGRADAGIAVDCTLHPTPKKHKPEGLRRKPDTQKLFWM